MALNYDDSNSLMNDYSFQGRVKVACLHFAQYIVDEDPITPAHTTRERWARGTFENPKMAADRVTPGVVMEPHVQADGTKVSDVDLQTDTETVVNRLM